MGNDLTIVMYHYVRDLKYSRYPKIKGLDIKLFKKQTQFFKNNYHFVRCEEVLEARYTNQTLPKNSLLLTFDDGYIEHYTNVFPILKENHIQGLFSVPGQLIAEHKVLDVNKIHFILSSSSVDNILKLIFGYLDYYRGLEHCFPENQELYQKLAIANRFDSADVVFIKRLLQVELEECLRKQMIDCLFQDCVGVEERVFAQELYMKKDQIEFMKREGMSFGIHGYTHDWLAFLEPQKVQADIEKALDVFDSVLDRNAWICCYPYGSYNETVVEIAKQFGAVAGLSTEVRIANLDQDDIMHLPRMDTNDFLYFKV